MGCKAYGAPLCRPTTLVLPNREKPLLGLPGGFWRVFGVACGYGLHILLPRTHATQKQGVYFIPVLIEFMTMR
jgi:hypothetical protein